MSISTRNGDAGDTRLFSGEVVRKTHPRPSAYGDLDEAVSAMGLARATSVSERVRSELLRIQKTCFVVGAELATAPEGLDGLPERLGSGHLAELDALVEGLEGEIELPPVFMVPGSTGASSALDLARSIIRRTERSVVALVDREAGAIPNDILLPWLNRLSDVLFLLARLEEREAGKGPEPLKRLSGA
jgi:cob(I)alamin adenosyltransferase